jgi:hypothetical protein
MTFREMAGWVMQYLIGARSGRTAQRAEDASAGQKEQIDDLQARAAVDDSVRDSGDATRRRELLGWTDPGSGPGSDKT